MKKCSKCKVEKKIEDYYKDKRNKDGLNRYCKVCMSLYDKKNKSTPKTKEYYKRYFAKPINKQRAKKYNKEYNAKPEIKERVKEYNKKQAILRKTNIDPIYKTYQYNADKRNINWNITPQDILNLPKICYLCGDKMNYFGIDRFNNEIGYEVNNIRPCCKTCNKIKMTHTKEFLIKHIIKMYKKQQQNDKSNAKKEN